MTTARSKTDRISVIGGDPTKPKVEAHVMVGFVVETRSPIESASAATRGRGGDR